MSSISNKSKIRYIFVSFIQCWKFWILNPGASGLKMESELYSSSAALKTSCLISVSYFKQIWPGLLRPSQVHQFSTSGPFMKFWGEWREKACGTILMVNVVWNNFVTEIVEWKSISGTERIQTFPFQASYQICWKGCELEFFVSR